MEQNSCGHDFNNLRFDVNEITCGCGKKWQIDIFSFVDLLGLAQTKILELTTELRYAKEDIGYLERTINESQWKN